MSEGKTPRSIVHGRWFVEFENGKVVKSVDNGVETLFKQAREMAKQSRMVRVGWTSLTDTEAALANINLRNNCIYIPDSLPTESVEIPPDITPDQIRPYTETDFDVNFSPLSTGKITNLRGVEYCVAFDKADGSSDVVLTVRPL